MLQTEREFTLPYGYIDERGNLHRRGTMRLAIAMDEVEPLRDARVRANEAYLGILLLSRVVTNLGDISPVSPAVVERLFAADFAYLQDLYLHMNTCIQDVESSQGVLAETQCPECGRRFALDLTLDVAGARGDG